MSVTGCQVPQSEIRQSDIRKMESYEYNGPKGNDAKQATKQLPTTISSRQWISDCIHTEANSPVLLIDLTKLLSSCCRASKQSVSGNTLKPSRNAHLQSLLQPFDCLWTIEKTY